MESSESFTVENCDAIAAEFGGLLAPLAAAGSERKLQHVKSINDQLEQWHSEILLSTQRTYQVPVLVSVVCTQGQIIRLVGYLPVRYLPVRYLPESMFLR